MGLDDTTQNQRVSNIHLEWQRKISILNSFKHLYVYTWIKSLCLIYRTFVSTYFHVSVNDHLLISWIFNSLKLFGKELSKMVNVSHSFWYSKLYCMSVQFFKFLTSYFLYAHNCPGMDTSKTAMVNLFLKIAVDNSIIWKVNDYRIYLGSDRLLFIASFSIFWNSTNFV